MSADINNACLKQIMLRWSLWFTYLTYSLVYFI